MSIFPYISYYRRKQIQYIAICVVVSLAIYTVVGDFKKALPFILSSISIIMGIYFKFVHDLKVRSFIGCTPECVLGEYFGILMAHALMTPFIEILDEKLAEKMKEKLEKCRRELVFITEKFSQIHHVDLREIITILREGKPEVIPEFLRSEKLSEVAEGILSPQVMMSVFKLYYMIFDLRGRTSKQIFMIVFLTEFIKTLLSIFEIKVRDKTIAEKLCEVELEKILEGKTERIPYLDAIITIMYNLVVMVHSEEYEIPLRDDIKNLLEKVSDILADPNIYDKITDEELRRKLEDVLTKIRKLALGVL